MVGQVYDSQDKDTKTMDSVLIGGVIAGMGGPVAEEDKGSEKRCMCCQTVSSSENDMALCQNHDME